MSNFYRKVPVVIEARQWLPDGDPNGVVQWMTDLQVSWDFDGTSILIGTLEGAMEAQPNDFVIKGVAGEFYPCKPDIFAETYTSVDA